MKHIFMALLLLLPCAQLLAQKKKPVTTTAKPTAKELAGIRAANIKKAAAIQFQYFVIKADSGSFGYRIYADGELYIQQTTIPSVAGAKGFPDTGRAAQTAQLVIRKIKEGEMPPTVTTKELKQLNIIQ